MKIEEGQIYETNKCGNVKVIEYRNCHDIIVQFQDETEYTCSVRSGNLKRGFVKNPYYKSLVGIGYIGEGPYKCYDYVDGRKKLSKMFNTWSNMIIRVYSPEHHIEFPAYKNSTVQDIWHNFQNFAEWYSLKQPIKDWELDKDILVKGNKEYGPELCCFVPKKINTILRTFKKDRELPTGVTKAWNKYRPDFAPSRRLYGKSFKSYETPEEAFDVYKAEKEHYIKVLANEYKDLLDNNVYSALINWQI